MIKITLLELIATMEVQKFSHAYKRHSNTLTESLIYSEKKPYFEIRVSIEPKPYITVIVCLCWRNTLMNETKS